MDDLLSLDRRAFLRGLTLTSAGLLVPRTTFAKSAAVLPGLTILNSTEPPIGFIDSLRYRAATNYHRWLIINGTWREEVLQIHNGVWCGFETKAVTVDEVVRASLPSP